MTDGIWAEYSINIKRPRQAMQDLLDLNPADLAADIGDYLLSETLLNFDQEQTPEGDKWEASQRALNEGGKTLQDRGHLRDSYVYQVLGGGEAVEIGSNIIYAAIHHFGGKTGRRNKRIELPARQALGLTPGMESEIGDMALEFYGAPLK